MPTFKSPMLPAAAAPNRLLERLARDSSGNAMMIVAAASIPLVALIGGGVDMGRGYLTETRLQQACDAGVLAARKKLAASAPLGGVIPGAVADTGNKFFNINFRAGTYGTVNRNFTMTLEPDYAISGAAVVDVPTTIMQIFGFDKLDVKANCSAKLNFNNTDIMMVLDTTQSMEAKADPGDANSKLVTMKNVVKSFHAQMEGSKGPGIRVRYGFVPYSTNVNVGALLQDSWVATNWNYQSREFDHTGPGPVTNQTTYENWVTTNGSYPATVLVNTYAATWHPPANESEAGYYSCDAALPTGTPAYSHVDTPDGPVVSTPWPGPPAGFRTVQHFKKRIDGQESWVSRNGLSCEVYSRTFNDYRQEYDKVTIPFQYNYDWYNYASLPKAVSTWRTDTAGCMEERETYEINDYSAVDFSRALDLDIRLTPTGDVKTKWRPMYPDIIYARELNSSGAGTFNFNPVVSSATFFQPRQISNMVSCPTVSRKLEEMQLVSGVNTDLDTYLASIVATGTTYHDIGMIWGGRLLTPFGLFAGENANVSVVKPTNRHLIFLTDGQTEAYDIAYGAYGVEPLDRRRWNKEAPAGGLTLTQVVDKRFALACSQVKADNITVWVVGLDTAVSQPMRDCAGPGRWFQANNAADLNNAFARIANSMGDLRITK